MSDLASRYKAAHPKTVLFEPSLCPEPTTDELKAFIDKYLADPQAGASDSGWTLRERFIAFALSATFKDCSILIRLSLSCSSDGTWRVSGNPIVKVIDLDIKALSKLRKWYDLDDFLWHYWRDHPPQVSAPQTKVSPDAVNEQPQRDFDKAEKARVGTSPAMMPAEGSPVRALSDRSAPQTPMKPDIEESKDHSAPPTAGGEQNRQHPLVMLAPALPMAVQDIIPAEITIENEAVTETIRAPATSDPSATPLPALTARRGFEGLDLADALAISPSSGSIPIKQRVSTEYEDVQPLPILPLMKEEARASNDNSPNVPATEAQELHAVTPMVNDSGRVPADEQYIVGPADQGGRHESRNRPRTPPSVSPVDRRRDRSVAPSPSPHPEEALQPGDEPYVDESRIAENPPVEVLASPTRPAGAMEPDSDIGRTSPLSPPCFNPLSAAEEAPQVDHQPYGASDYVDRPKEEVESHPNHNETQSSAILSSATTVAAASAAAVVGVFEAVTGVAAAAIHVASPTRSTHDQERSEREDLPHHTNPSMPVATVAGVVPADDSDVMETSSDPKHADSLPDNRFAELPQPDARDGTLVAEAVETPIEPPIGNLAEEYVEEPAEKAQETPCMTPAAEPDIVDNDYISKYERRSLTVSPVVNWRINGLKSSSLPQPAEIESAMTTNKSVTSMGPVDISDHIEHQTHESPHLELEQEPNDAPIPGAYTSGPNVSVAEATPPVPIEGDTNKTSLQAVGGSFIEPIGSPQGIGRAAYKEEAIDAPTPSALTSEPIHAATGDMADEHSAEFQETGELQDDDQVLWDGSGVPELSPKSIKRSTFGQVEEDTVAHLVEESNEGPAGGLLAGDRTFGEDCEVTHLADPAGASGKYRPQQEMSGDNVQHIQPGVVITGLPATASNQFLRSQAAQVENLFHPSGGHVSHSNREEQSPVAEDIDDDIEHMHYPIGEMEDSGKILPNRSPGLRR